MTLGDSITAGRLQLVLHNNMRQLMKALICYTGFGIMGEHKDIAEDLNEYRVSDVLPVSLVRIIAP